MSFPESFQWFHTEPDFQSLYCLSAVVTFIKASGVLNQLCSKFLGVYKVAAWDREDPQERQ
jgi:hypothetical protein